MPPRKSQEDGQFAVIEAAAKAAVTENDGTTDDDRLNALEKRIADIEPLMEQLQATTRLNERIADYVGDLKDEQVFFNKARYAVGVLSLTALILLAFLLFMALFDTRSPLLSSPPAVVAAFVLGIISGMILILVSFIKGVFRSTVERHADGFLPPALDSLVKAAGKSVGKQN